MERLDGRLEERLFLNLRSLDKERLKIAAIADGRSVAGKARQLILAGLANVRPAKTGDRNADA